jgi:hypothetical protein
MAEERSMLGRTAAILALGSLLVGLLVGYLFWGRVPHQQELSDARARLAEQTQRADGLQRQVEDLRRKYTETEAELTRAGEGLRREREAREALEEVVSKGRK